MSSFTLGPLPSGAVIRVEVRDLRLRPPRSHDTSPAAEDVVSVTEAVYRLCCSTWIIYYWIDIGKARRLPRSGRPRLHISWNEQIQAECRGRIEQSGHLNPTVRRLSPVSGLSRRQMSVPAAIVTTSAQTASGQCRLQNTKFRPRPDCGRGSMKSPFARSALSPASPR